MDESGATMTYSIDSAAEKKLPSLIQYLEESIFEETLVQDYCLERTSMDEVFINVGKRFEMANGGIRKRRTKEDRDQEQ